jgi:hypothetical protein
MIGEKRTESLLVALAVSGVLVFSLTPSPRLRFGVSRLPALRKIYQCQSIGVADPGCLSRIQGQKDSRIRIRIKELSTGILILKIVFKLSEISSGLFIPDPDPGSCGQRGTGSRIRIRNTASRYLVSVFLLYCRGLHIINPRVSS